MSVVDKMTQLHVLRVFLGPDGHGGNLLGVVLSGADVPSARRQEIARSRDLPEIVFVDNPRSGRMTIHTPSRELSFAGHPMVGTGWLLRQQGHDLSELQPSAGAVPSWDEDGLSWIRSQTSWAPQFPIRQYADSTELEALFVPPSGNDFFYGWAWLDESAGIVRSRAFIAGDPPREENATSRAAVVLSTQLNRPLDVRQGPGSRILTRPGTNGSISIGGRVALEDVEIVPT